MSESDPDPIPLYSAYLISPPAWSETVPNAESSLAIVAGKTTQPCSKHPGARGAEKTMVVPCVIGHVGLLAASLHIHAP